MQLVFKIITAIALSIIVFTILGVVWAWVSWRCGRCGKPFLAFNLEDKYLGRFGFGAICSECFNKSFGRRYELEQQRLEEKRKRIAGKITNSKHH